MSLPTLGVSLPTFWVGLMLIQVVSFQWELLPALGNEGVRGLVLPAITLALPTGAVIGQILARSLLATLADPYIETATAKGAGRVRIHLRHALPNAAIPALTMVGVLAGNLLAGSVVIETVFSRSGIGRITVAAVSTQDLPVVQGVVVLGALVFVTANLIVDLLYPLLDPRIVVAGKRNIVVGSPA
jgi:peptide/nickel transport system permease protein